MFGNFVFQKNFQKTSASNNLFYVRKKKSLIHINIHKFNNATIQILIIHQPYFMPYQTNHYNGQR